MQQVRALRPLWIYGMFSLSGATALVYQVLWSSWLSLTFGSTTTSISIVLASFMLGLALGSWAASRALHRTGHPLRIYAFLELGIGAFAVSFPALAQLTESAYTLVISTESPEAASIAVRAVLSILLLLAPTTLMGATLPYLTEFFHRSPAHSRTWRTCRNGTLSRRRTSRMFRSRACSSRASRSPTITPGWNSICSGRGRKAR